MNKKSITIIFKDWLESNLVKLQRKCPICKNMLKDSKYVSLCHLKNKDTKWICEKCANDFIKDGVPEFILTDELLKDIKEKFNKSNHHE